VGLKAHWLIDWLIDWLITHLSISDQILGVFLKRKQPNSHDVPGSVNSQTELSSVMVWRTVDFFQTHRLIAAKILLSKNTRASVICSERRRPAIDRAASLSTDCRPSLIRKKCLLISLMHRVFISFKQWKTFSIGFCEFYSLYCVEWNCCHVFLFHLSYFCLLFCLLVLPYYVVNKVEYIGCSTEG